MRLKASSLLIISGLFMALFAPLVQAAPNVFVDEFHTNPCTDGKWNQICGGDGVSREVNDTGQDFAVLQVDASGGGSQLYGIFTPANSNPGSIWFTTQATANFTTNESIRSFLISTVYDSSFNRMFEFTQSNYNGSVFFGQRAARCGDVDSDPFTPPYYTAVPFGFWAVAVTRDVSGIHCKFFNQQGVQVFDLTSLTCGGIACDLTAIDRVYISAGAELSAPFEPVWVNFVRMGNVGSAPTFDCNDVVNGCIDPPSVVTLSADSIHYADARLRGDLVDTGGASHTEVWFIFGTAEQTLNGSLLGDSSCGCWQETPHQTVTHTGIFFRVITGLQQNTTYYFAAIADNIFVVGGSQVSFVTDPVSHITDNAFNWFWLLVYVGFIILGLYGAWWIRRKRSTGGLL